jgi:hypothetical protein
MHNDEAARRDSDHNRVDSRPPAEATRNSLPAANDERSEQVSAETAERRRAVEENPMLQDEEELRSELPR